MKVLTHVVKKGENLNKIAAKYGYKNFDIIYKHKENAKFRKLRPNPSKIMPGDEVRIPPANSAAMVVDRKSLKEIESVLASLKKNRKEAAQDFKALRKDVTSEYLKVKKASDKNDLNALLLTLGTGLAFKVGAAYKSTQLAGSKLILHNKKFLKQFVIDKGIQDSQFIAQAFRDDIKETTTAGLWGKRAVSVIAGLMTPSFWAGAAIEVAKGNWDPVKWTNALKRIEKSALSKVGEVEKNALQNLDLRIAKYEKALKMARSMAKG